MGVNAVWLQRTIFCVLPLGEQYWGIWWDAVARFWECVRYPWKYFAMEDNAKTSKFSAGQLCFCLLKVCAILLFCVFNTKQIHLLSFRYQVWICLFIPTNFPTTIVTVMWGGRGNCHRRDSEVSGIFVGNGMLCVASKMGAFPTSLLHTASPPLRYLPCEKSLLKSSVRGQTLPERRL